MSCAPVATLCSPAASAAAFMCAGMPRTSCSLPAGLCSWPLTSLIGFSHLYLQDWLLALLHDAGVARPTGQVRSSEGSKSPHRSRGARPAAPRCLAERTLHSSIILESRHLR